MRYITSKVLKFNENNINGDCHYCETETLPRDVNSLELYFFILFYLLFALYPKQFYYLQVLGTKYQNKLLEIIDARYLLEYFLVNILR